MALKDWKRRRDLEDDVQVVVFTKKNMGIFIDKNKSNYGLDIFKGDVVVIEKEFKTKKQALKFARAYMRKH